MNPKNELIELINYSLWKTSEVNNENNPVYTSQIELEILDKELSAVSDALTSKIEAENDCSRKILDKIHPLTPLVSSKNEYPNPKNSLLNIITSFLWKTENINTDKTTTPIFSSSASVKLFGKKFSAISDGCPSKKEAEKNCSQKILDKIYPLFLEKKFDFLPYNIKLTRYYRKANRRNKELEQRLVS